jgi:hypothetical protein
LNKQPHKNQLGSKLIKSEGNNISKVENMGVISQGKEETRRENS